MKKMIAIVLVFVMALSYVFAASGEYAVSEGISLSMLNQDPDPVEPRRP